MLLPQGPWYPIADDESMRLAALRRLDLLNKPPNERFDRITALARDLFGVSHAAVTLIGDHESHFISAAGAAGVGIAQRKVNMCAWIVDPNQGTEVMVVPDASQDQRFSSFPVVTGEHRRPGPLVCE